MSNHPTTPMTQGQPPSPTNLEYIRTKGGSEYIVEEAHVSHYIDGKVIAGTLHGTRERLVIQYSDLTKHRCLDRDVLTGELIVNETRMPRSLV